jgi:hypothetical protein
MYIQTLVAIAAGPAAILMIAMGLRATTTSWSDLRGRR